MAKNTATKNAITENSIVKNEAKNGMELRLADKVGSEKFAELTQQRGWKYSSRLGYFWQKYDEAEYKKAEAEFCKAAPKKAAAKKAAAKNIDAELAELLTLFGVNPDGEVEVLATKDNTPEAEAKKPAAKKPAAKKPAAKKEAKAEAPKAEVKKESPKKAAPKAETKATGFVDEVKAGLLSADAFDDLTAWKISVMDCVSALLDDALLQLAENRK